MSQSTASGCQKAPTRFLPSGRFTPVLPPIAASTMPRSVVGTCTTGTPRWYAAAANPATSVTSPPPTATTTSARVSPQDAHARHSASTAASVLFASPSAISKRRCSRPGSIASSMSAWVTMAARVAPDGRTPASSVADPGTDEHRVGAAAEGDLDRGHAVTWASWATTRSAMCSASACFGFSSRAWNGSTLTVMSATSS